MCVLVSTFPWKELLSIDPDKQFGFRITKAHFVLMVFSKRHDSVVEKALEYVSYYLSSSPY